jgi:hypothetical protein
MKTKTTTTQTTNTTTNPYNSYMEFITAKESDLYTYGYYVANKCLFNKESKTAQSFLYELINHRFEDVQVNHLTEKVEQIAQHEAQHEAHAKARDEAYRKSNCITRTAEDRADYYKQYLHFKHLAKVELDRIITLSQQLDVISTDYSDLIQTALVQHIINQSEPPTISEKTLQSYSVEAVEELTAEQLEEAQHRQNFKACCSAVNTYMNNELHHTSHNRTSTKVIKKLPDDIIELIKQGQTIITYISTNERTKAITRHTFAFDEVTNKYKCILPTTNYYTFDFKDTKKYKGWHLTYHYKTVRNISKLESYTNEDGDQTDITHLMAGFKADHNNKVIEAVEQSLTDEETALKLINHKDLTPRQRIYIKHLASEVADIIGEKTKQAYFNMCDKSEVTPNNKKAIQLVYNSKKAYAFNKLIEEVNKEREEKGEKKKPYTMNAEARKKFITNLRSKIKSIKSEERKSEDIRPTAPKQADLIKWTDTANSKQRQAVIKWTNHNYTYEPITAEEKHIEHLKALHHNQKYQAHIQVLEYRRMLRDTQEFINIDNQGCSNTKYYQYQTSCRSAKHSAFTFFEQMTETEKIKAIKEN